MAQHPEGSKQEKAEQNRQQRDEERGRDWGDEAARARTADDPRVMAPRDAAGRPSTGESI